MKPSTFFSVTPVDREDQAWLRCTACSRLAWVYLQGSPLQHWDWPAACQDWWDECIAFHNPRKHKRAPVLFCSCWQNLFQDYWKPDVVLTVVLKLSGHPEDSGLPSAGGLLHGHQSPASVQPGSQPTGEPFCCFTWLNFLASLPSLDLYVTCFGNVAHTVPFSRCVGLSGSLNRSSIADIKREEKEDDENCSIADRSEDEKKDMKARLGSRCLKPFICKHA